MAARRGQGQKRACTVTAEDRRGDDPNTAESRRKVPVAWEALEDAFENNAPEVHSYLHQGTGEVIRVVDGIADPATHARISSDPTYLRVDPVSSREQYRWMERFIATVEEGPLRSKLLAAIDGKGAFRRFKDVLMGFPVDRERWFTFRSERLRTCMESWLEAQGVEAVARPEWQVPSAEDVKPLVEAPVEKAAPPRRTVVSGTGTSRTSAAEAQRRRLRELSDALPARELDTALAFLEFLRDRRPPSTTLGGASAPLGRASSRGDRDDNHESAGRSRFEDGGDDARDRDRDERDQAHDRYRDDDLDERN
jgi:hypothetical protein